MERSKSLSVDHFKDATIEFLEGINARRTLLTEEEKNKVVEGLEDFLCETEIREQIASFKNLILSWLQQWKGTKEAEEKKEPRNEQRFQLADGLLVVLKKFQESLSRFSPRELSGVEEREFKPVKGLVRSQINILLGKAVVQSEEEMDIAS